MAASPRAEHQKFRAAAAAELPPSVGFFFPTWEFPSLQLWCVSLRVLELLTVPFSAIFPCLQPDLLQLQFTCFPHSFFSQHAALLRGPSQGHADAPCGNPGIRDRAEPSQGSLARLKFKTASPHLHRNDIKYCLDIICLLISLSAFKKKNKDVPAFMYFLRHAHSWCDILCFEVTPAKVFSPVILAGAQVLVWSCGWLGRAEPNLVIGILHVQGSENTLGGKFVFSPRVRYVFFQTFFSLKDFSALLSPEDKWNERICKSTEWQHKGGWLKTERGEV